MDRQKLILNVIIYIILTSFFIYIFWNEKKLVEKISEKKEKFCDRIIEKHKIEDEGKAKVLKVLVHWVETIITALILVFIIQRFYIGNFMVPTASMAETIIPGDRILGNMVIYNFREPKREEIIVFWEPIKNKDRYTKRLMALPGETVEIYGGLLHIDGKAISERRYSSLGKMAGETWIVPKRGDKIEIIPGGDYNLAYKTAQYNIEEVQKELKTNPGAIDEILPNVEFRVNGKKTGMLLDLINDKEVIKKIFAGEKVEVVLNQNYYMALGDNTDNSYDSRMWGFVAQDRILGQAFVRFWPLNRMSLLRGEMEFNIVEEAKN